MYWTYSRMTPAGKESSQIFIITDFATSEGNTTPFAYYEWRILSDIFKGCGYNFNNTFRSYLCAHAPKIKKADFKPKRVQKATVEEFDHEEAVKRLCEEITLINPNVVLLLGELPLQLFTNGFNIWKFNGSIIEPKQWIQQLVPNHLKWIPILHPRDMNAVYKSRFYTQAYIERAIRWSNIKQPYKPNYSISILETVESVYNYCNYIERRLRTEPENFLVVDIELYLNCITAIGMCVSDSEAACTPLYGGGNSALEIAAKLKRLSQLFNSGIPVVNQNVHFDNKHMTRHGLPIKNIIGDTALNNSILYPQFDNNLGFLNSLYTTMPYFKDEGKNYEPSKNLYTYCAKDCLSTRLIYKEQQKEIEEEKLNDVVARQMAYSFVYAKINTHGIRIDAEVKKALNEKYQGITEQTKLMLNGAIGFELNANSPKQCAELVYDYMELPKQKKRDPATGEWRVTTDADTLEYLALNHCDQAQRNVLHYIIRLRKLSKIDNHINIPLHEDGRLRTNYNLGGTFTGRTSGNKSGDWYYSFNPKGQLEFTNLGHSLQTLPKHGFEISDGTRLGDDLRKMFVPSNGYLFVEGDQSKAEAVVVTVLARDWALLERFYEINLHKYTACQVFGIDKPEDVDYDHYNKGKRARHAANYDMQHKTLAKNALIPESEAKIILVNFHKANPHIKRVYHAEVAEFLTSKGFLQTPYGRRCQFFDRLNDKATHRQGYSYIPQSTVAEKTKIGMLRISEYAKDKNLDMALLAESHDSILAEVKKESVPEYCEALHKIMEEPIDFNKGSLPRDVKFTIKFELQTGENWKEMEDYGGRL